MSFIGCYLLRSLHPKGKGRTYIGFTTNPERRIRQHNGQLAHGAWKTKKWRPWDMVMVVYGFPNQTTALQFEWTWQHPDVSLDVREVVQGKPASTWYGVRGKIRVVMEMLHVQPWCYFPLKVRFLSGENGRMRDGCRDAPLHMPVSVGPVGDVVGGVGGESVVMYSHRSHTYGESMVRGEEGEGYLGTMTTTMEPTTMATTASLKDTDDNITELNDPSDASSETKLETKINAKKKKKKKESKTACYVCHEPAKRMWHTCYICRARTHVGCLAEFSLSQHPAFGGSMLPEYGICPSCLDKNAWGTVLQSLENIGWRKHKDGDGAVDSKDGDEDGGGEIDEHRCNGPTDTKSGPTDTTSGPTDTTSGPTDTTSGPTDTTSGPTDTDNGAQYGTRKDEDCHEDKENFVIPAHAGMDACRYIDESMMAMYNGQIQTVTSDGMTPTASNTASQVLTEQRVKRSTTMSDYKAFALSCIDEESLDDADSLASRMLRRLVHDDGHEQHRTPQANCSISAPGDCIDLRTPESHVKHDQQRRDVDRMAASPYDPCASTSPAPIEEDPEHPHMMASPEVVDLCSSPP